MVEVESLESVVEVVFVADSKLLVMMVLLAVVALCWQQLKLSAEK